MKLVTAIMPTRGRGSMALQAIRCFLSQTYPCKELIILDDMQDPSLPRYGENASEIETTNIAVLKLEGRESIAKKRNILAELAQGEIIWTLDDDDWSSPFRMEQQVKRLEETGRSVTGYKTLLFHDGAKAYRYVGPSSYALGTSLCYLRSWALEHPFPETGGPIDLVTKLQTCSDNGFVNAAMRAQQLDTVDGLSMMVARVHAKNSSYKNMDAPNYRPIALSELPEGYPE